MKPESGNWKLGGGKMGALMQKLESGSQKREFSDQKIDLWVENWCSEVPGTNQVTAKDAHPCGPERKGQTWLREGRFAPAGRKG